MNKWAVFWFHFKKIVFSPYLYVLCFLSLIVFIISISLSSFIKVDSFDLNKITTTNIKKETVCINDLTNQNLIAKLKENKNNLLNYETNSKCNDLKLISINNNSYKIISSSQKFNLSSIIIDLENYNKNKYLIKQNYKPLNINVESKNNADLNSLIIQNVLKTATIVIMFSLTMYLITLIFRQIAFEKINKIWDMTSNRLNPIFLIFIKIISCISLVMIPIILNYILFSIANYFKWLPILNIIKLPPFDFSLIFLVAVEFILTFTLYSIISSYVALYVKTVEQIQSYVGYVAIVGVLSYLLALLSTTIPNMNNLKIISFYNPFSTLFGFFSSIEVIKNYEFLILVPIIMQIVLILIFVKLIKIKFKKS